MTTAIDASAVVAILVGEPDRQRSLDELEVCARPLICCAVTQYEAVLATARVLAFSVEDAADAVSDFLTLSAIEITPITAEHGMLAIEAFQRFGKGRHPTALNMGDCFSFALARQAHAHLIFKGDDFAHPEVQSALRA